MNIIEKIRLKAASKPATIVFPESEDPRTLRAVAFLLERKIVKPVLIGNIRRVHKLAKEYGVVIPDHTIINHLMDDDRKLFAEDFYERRKVKGVTKEYANQILQNPLYFGAYMASQGRADGCVAGAINTTGDVLRAALFCIGTKTSGSVVSSIFLMSFPDGRVVTYGDCAVVPYPTDSQLAHIAIDAAKNHQALTGETPIVAMLSFSTKGSAEHQSVHLVRSATDLAKNMNPELAIDGEIQFDAATVPDISLKKAPGSIVRGEANVLIFPNLDAGNISYKITERLGGATATGPVIQGLKKPMNDLSRGCSWEDIVNTAAVTAIQSGLN